MQDFVKTRNMSYILILLIVTFAFVIAECLATGHERLQRQIYYLAFAWVVIWCTAKYAYGSDIHTYIPFYESLRHPIGDLSNPDLYFEKGFVFFCSCLKSIGFTFWGMTALVSLLYFTAIALLWRQLKTYKTIGLFALVCLDYNLILMEFRQCIAVTLFIFLILAFQQKRYVWCVVCAALAITMHKSAFIILICAAGFYLFRKLPVTKRGYLLLTVMIMMLMFVPLQPLLAKIASFLPISGSVLRSLEHHLLVGKTFQKVFVLYAATMLILAYYKRNDTTNKTLHWIMWCCGAVLVCLYPYWFLLNRLRSYFVPFLIIYIIGTLQGKDIRDVLPRQLYTVFVMLYFLWVALSIPKTNSGLKYPTDNISLVFERAKHGERELQNRQLKQAALYWEYDYKVMISKGVTQ